jgi:hypothetical protein
MLPVSNGRLIWKRLNDRKRERVEHDLKRSTSGYADHAEHTISKLQQAYLKKYQSQQYDYLADASQHPQDVPNDGFGSRVSSLFRGWWEDWQVPSEEGIADVAHRFRLGLLNRPTALVFDDDCREAVTQLNKKRLFRTKILEDGYDVSDNLCFDIR